MYDKNIIFKKNNIYANIQQESNSTIQYKPSTIIASDFDEVVILEYISNNLNNMPGTNKVMVAIFNNNTVEFKYDTIDNLKNISNIKKVFSKELNEQEKQLISNIIKGNIILKNNIVYVENFNEVE